MSNAGDFSPHLEMPDEHFRERHGQVCSAVVVLERFRH